MLWKLVLIYYILMSVVSAIMHAWDKHQAVRNRWRVREKSLHSIELIGGWPGALLMTRTIKHKVSKPSYMRLLYAIAALHFLTAFALLWLATR
jgi:uncharacterized membrane protein YsdA (DUF1294 family)